MVAICMYRDAGLAAGLNRDTSAVRFTRGRYPRTPTSCFSGAFPLRGAPLPPLPFASALLFASACLDDRLLWGEVDSKSNSRLAAITPSAATSVVLSSSSSCRTTSGRSSSSGGPSKVASCGSSLSNSRISSNTLCSCRAIKSDAFQYRKNTRNESGSSHRSNVAPPRDVRRKSFCWCEALDRWDWLRGGPPCGLRMSMREAVWTPLW
mmetsp:Transcript_37305/g.81252  ORF Transcript_37305/g.81252 Transcript_37305/m.81252 type:complete len:208 (+) Transcript_37305:1037-1660(+)